MVFLAELDTPYDYDLLRPRHDTARVAILSSAIAKPLGSGTCPIWKNSNCGSGSLERKKGSLIPAAIDVWKPGNSDSTRAIMR